MAEVSSCSRVHLWLGKPKTFTLRLFPEKVCWLRYTAVFIKMLSFGIQNIDNLSFSPKSVLWPEESRNVLYSCPASLLWAEVNVQAHVTGRHSTVFRKWPEWGRQANKQSAQDTAPDTMDTELSMSLLLGVISKLSKLHLCSLASMRIMNLEISFWFSGPKPHAHIW